MRVAEGVAARGLDGIEALAVAQLAPELAERIASFERVIFVDASLECREVVACALAPRAFAPGAAEPLTHALDPRGLLALAQRLFGRAPAAWIVTVPAFDVGLGEELSHETAALRDRAISAVLDLAI